MGRDYRTIEGVSVDRDSDSDISLTLRFDVLNDDAAYVTVPLSLALGMMRDLANAIGNGINSAALDMQVGDCETCRNVRLINEPTSGGRSKAVRCPDCGPRYKAATHADRLARPRIGGGVR